MLLSALRNLFIKMSGPVVVFGFGFLACAVIQGTGILRYFWKYEIAGSPQAECLIIGLGIVLAGGVLWLFRRSGPLAPEWTPQRRDRPSSGA